MHIGSVLSAPWSGWTMFALLMCAVLAEFFQPGVVTQAPQALIARSDRTYKESPTNFLGQFFISIFRIGTPAMAICVCFCPTDRAPFVAFCAVCGILFAILLLKMLCNSLLDYTFMLSRYFGSPYEIYGNIATLAALALYPLVMIVMHVAKVAPVQWAIGIMAVLFLLAWLYRSARLFITSPSALLYLLVYFATLEVLPLAAFIYLSAKTITIL